MKESVDCAFPQPTSCSPAGDVYYSHEDGYGGMTLRDYFAAKAMQGMLRNVPAGSADVQIAEFAYELADAMLRVRANGTTKP